MTPSEVFQADDAHADGVPARPPTLFPRCGWLSGPGPALDRQAADRTAAAHGGDARQKLTDSTPGNASRRSTAWGRTPGPARACSAAG